MGWVQLGGILSFPLGLLTSSQQQEITAHSDSLEEQGKFSAPSGKMGTDVHEVVSELAPQWASRSAWLGDRGSRVTLPDLHNLLLSYCHWVG